MRWDSIHDLVSFHERRQRAVGAGWAPPVDVFETADAYVVVVELAGLEPGDFDVQATDETLTVSGRRGGEVGDVRFLHVERGYGEFSRAFAFPERIDVRAVSASFRNGLLTVTVPKRPSAGTLRIDVRP
ncbi:MAG TPA: Hsp20/alpha crystallin family protein [Vicinamibacterales bacterium]